MLVLFLGMALSVPAFAITEAEVEAQVSATSREAVTGNVLIWFLCAIGFLKVSQKIDSFIASLGVNVGHTGGSMLAEVMIATRGVASITSSFGSGGACHAGGSSSWGVPPGPSGPFGGFLRGGLAGVVSRKATNDAVRTATRETSAVHTVRSTAAETASQSQTIVDQQAATARKTDTQTGTHQESQTAAHSAFTEISTQTVSKTSHTNSAATQSDRRTSAPPFKGVGLGGAIFAKSLLSGGSFANDVIGTVAKGDIRTTGSITGDLAAQSLRSYLGHSGDGTQAQTPLTFSNVEIGGGRITGMVSRPDIDEPMAFSMYYADQYT